VFTAKAFEPSAVFWEPVVFVAKAPWPIAVFVAIPPAPGDVIPTDAFKLATATVPVNVGLADKTTDPVPVDDVTPVPPFATASSPVAWPIGRLVKDAPEPEKVVAVTVPVNVGLADKTTDPLPVDDVTPVPPFATASSPVAWPIGRLVKDAPEPEKVAAVILPSPDKLFEL